MFRVIYYDENGIPRCYGDGATEHEAKEQADLALEDYKKTRPDIERYCYSTFET